MLVIHPQCATSTVCIKVNATDDLVPSREFVSARVFDGRRGARRRAALRRRSISVFTRISASHGDDHVKLSSATHAASVARRDLPLDLRSSCSLICQNGARRLQQERAQLDDPIVLMRSTGEHRERGRGGESFGFILGSKRAGLRSAFRVRGGCTGSVLRTCFHEHFTKVDESVVRVRAVAKHGQGQGNLAPAQRLGEDVQG